MKAIIIGQNHTVTTYQVNGKKRYIIEDIPVSNSRIIVNLTVAKVGRKWADVFNHLDNIYPVMPKALESAIDSMTY